MPSKYWEDSAELSRDSSAESDEETEEGHEDEVESSKAGSTSTSNAEAGTVSRVISSNFNLPALEPHEHANLFYLSLIEGRCRTQAAASINAGRGANELLGEDHPEVSALAQHLFTEMSKELVKAGMIPKGYVARPLSELRLYLRSFDSVLNGIAMQPRDISETRAQRVLEFEDARSSNLRSNTRSNPVLLRTAGPVDDISYTDPFDRSPGPRSIFRTPTIDDPSSHDASQIEDFAYMKTRPNFGQPFSQALVRRNNPNHAMQLITSPGHVFTNPVLPQSQEALPSSKFASEYAKTATLGKGGFGKVVKAVSRVDRAEYAIKRIKTPAMKMRQLAQSGRMEELLKEVQALARYNHPHIVRYFHAWVETQLPGIETDCTWSDEENDEEDTVSSSEVSESQTDSVAVDMENLALQNQQALDDEFRLRRANTTTHQVNSDQVIFEVENSARSATKRSFFRSAADPESSESDEEQDQEATASDGSTSTISLSRHPTNEGALISQGGYHMPGSFMDCLIYIKMTSYPLTLADFIFPSVDTVSENNLSALNPQHCFHPLPTIRLILCLVSGLAYLHRKNEIHRDLKPANIFLSILDDEDQPNESWVDLGDCLECSASDSKRRGCYISPCIGDFGLVVDLKDLNSSTVSDSPATFDDSSRQHIPGTKLYIPPTQSSHNIICPKLDVYALGVITFELLHKFETKTERFCVLNDAREGKWPTGWDQDIGMTTMGSSSDDPELRQLLSKGVRGMMEAQIEKRWSLDDVKKWAIIVEGHCKQRQTLK